MNTLFIFICMIMALQLCISFLLYQIDWPLMWCLLLILLPFGIGLFLIQIFYYERYYPNWKVPFKTKILLKYMYILTLFQFVGLYLMLFVF
ncbi:hypothetical protein DOS70_04125 [Staphylococcus felis]|uniref:Uncharacterized protein n=1 Tax=Staphylococcus felis TaxID=46127 RepID=A0A2K3ZJF9_9STAP|nr:hypothetical protein [Staphylococcus felis]AVP35660.1 hypothetical protein C7J90_01255 [Staphylococcus felis]PNZ38017.1 hypothetical protein CD143_01115 [Staphylococcus felis]REH75276.1 hypothetical protein DOS57_10040 [Staphylococcus felis]REH76319.1 hypothetical protein DOS60_07710 [Staphylococcus felis]REH79857.1 hypothetical protein DOS59_02730 [Staphylococcus felis]